jgi:hypothetical protein
MVVAQERTTVVVIAAVGTLDPRIVTAVALCGVPLLVAARALSLLAPSPAGGESFLALDGRASVAAHEAGRTLGTVHVTAAYVVTGVPGVIAAQPLPTVAFTSAALAIGSALDGRRAGTADGDVTITDRTVVRAVLVAAACAALDPGRVAAHPVAHEAIPAASLEPEAACSRAGEVLLAGIVTDALSVRAAVPPGSERASAANTGGRVPALQDVVTAALLIDPSSVDASLALAGERIPITLRIGARRAPYLAALGARGTVAEGGAVPEQTGLALLAQVPLYEPLEAASSGTAPIVLLLIVPTASPVDPLAPVAFTAAGIVVPVLAA